MRRARAGRPRGAIKGSGASTFARREATVTGLGCVTPLGVGRAAYAAGLRAGRSGVVSLAGRPGFGADAYAAVCSDFDPAPILDRIGRRAEEVSRAVPLAVAAAEEALEDAGILEAEEEERRATAVVVGTGGAAADFVEWAYHARRPTVYAISSGTPGGIASEVSTAFGLLGPSLVVSTGCTSSSDAVGIARDLLAAGRARRVLVGGVDAPIAPRIYEGFRRMKVLSTRYGDEPARASRPFDRGRDGFVLGEGAWFFVLEREEDALSRPRARIVGYAATCEAGHRVALSEDPREAVRAVEETLAEAGWAGHEIDWIAAHGTSTEMNDRIEAKVLRKALGAAGSGAMSGDAGAAAESVPVSSVKSMIGHPQGASGAASLAAAILAMDGGFLPPSVNLEDPDPACDLAHVGPARAAEVRRVLVNCLGFGSKNAALAVERV